VQWSLNPKPWSQACSATCEMQYGIAMLGTETSNGSNKKAVSCLRMQTSRPTVSSGAAAAAGGVRYIIAGVKVGDPGSKTAIMLTYIDPLSFGDPENSPRGGGKEGGASREIVH